MKWCLGWRKGGMKKDTISFRIYSKRLNIKFERQEYGGRRRKNNYEKYLIDCQDMNI